MIIVFVLVGVLLFGGGVATIIDGLPYLVLERGFTQVIVGTVVATGGVIILALSRVLSELRNVRATLSNAMMAVSVASLSREPPAPHAQGAALTAGAGAAAGIGAALIADKLAGASQDETPDTAGETVPQEAQEAQEPDLFAKLLDEADLRAEPASDQAVAEEAAAEVAREPEEAADLWVRTAESDDRPEPHLAAVAEALEQPPEPAEELVADEAQPEDIQSEDSEIAGATSALPQDEAALPEARAEPWLGWPEPALDPEPVAASKDDEEKREPADEFGFLRERLSGRVTDPDSASTGRRETWRSGSLKDAESWMTPVGSRREPWFEPQAAPEEPEQAPEIPETETVDPARTLEPPVWPPQTREAVVSEPDSAGTQAEPEDTDPQSEPDTNGADEAALRATVEEDIPAPTQPEAPVMAEAPAPAASEEGIVGAYQVGDAHFTIFANGSIKARTPDGDYNFASMDELKTYLASEKSRLGV